MWRRCRALFIAAALAGAQQLGQNKPAGTGDNFTLSVKVQLVVEAVVVKDKDGKPVQGLTAKDFALTEDGVPQSISFCEHQALSALAAPLPVAKPDSEDIKVYKKLARTQLATETVENGRYKNHRLLALYFDMSAMYPADQLRALSAAQKFIRTQLTTVDMVSILRYQGGAVDILQDFTADRNKLLSILETMIGECGRRQQRGHGSGLWPGRQRVQRVQYRSPALCVADRSQDARPIEREKIAGLLCQWAAIEWH